MSRVVFLGLPATGHINPTIGLVKELLTRGEEVIYYNTPEFQSKIISTGVVFRSYPLDITVSGNKMNGLKKDLIKAEPDGINPLNQLGRQMNEEMSLYKEIMNHPTFDLKAEIAALNPDYILHDSCAYWGKVVAKQLGIPAIASVTTFAYCDRILEQYPEFVIGKILEFPSFKADLSLITKVIQRISKMMGDLLNIEDFDCIDMSFSQEALNIVYTSKEFQWYGEVFGAGFKFVGPSLYPRNDSGRFPFERLSGAELIYISLGTILSNHPSVFDFYRKCFVAFGASGKQVILSIGNGNLNQLGDIPNNFIVRNTVPQIDILKRASVMITHGGMNSVNEALYYHVPLIIIPQRWDQFLVAERVEGLGAGVYLKEKDFQARELAAAVEQIFQNESYRYHCQIIGETLRTAGGCRRAVDEISQFKLENSIK